MQGCEMRNLQGKEMRTLRILRCQEIVQYCKLHRKQGEGEQNERCKKRSLSFLAVCAIFLGLTRYQPDCLVLAKDSHFIANTIAWTA